MRVERAAGKADIAGTIVAEALHQRTLAADNADRQSAAQRLAVGHQIGANAEIILRAALGEAEADEDLVEDQNDAAFGADRTKVLEPFGIGIAVEMRAAAAVDKLGVGRRRTR